MLYYARRQVGSTGGSSATAYRSGGGDRMSNIELLNILLAIAGLALSAYALGKQNRQ